MCTAKDYVEALEELFDTLAGLEVGEVKDLDGNVRVKKLDEDTIRWFRHLGQHVDLSVDMAASAILFD